MFQIRIHGRGGQGVVTGAEMLSIAAFEQGQHAQAFPSFGSERTGAPVVAFCRLSDALIIQDPTLLHQVDVFQGLQPDGYVLINSTRSFDQLGVGDFVRQFRRERLCNVPASEIARAHVGRPLPNAALLGGFAAISGLISLDAVVHAIRDKFAGAVAEGNAAAAAEAFAYVKKEVEELAHAQTD